MRGRWLGPGSSAVTRRSCGRLRGTRAGNPVVDGRTRAVPSTSVENRSPIRFAIRSGGKRAGYWRLRAGLKLPELFLEREGYGKKFHFSLYASGQWHMKEGRQERIRWARPGKVVPGYTRALGVVQPVATAVREDPPAEETMLVAVPADANPTTFSLFIERPGADLDNSWPGKNADGTTLVGRIPLAAGAGTCCVVALQQPLQPGRADFPRPSGAELRWMRDVAARGPLITTIIGELSDGAIALIDLRADESVQAALDRALE